MTETKTLCSDCGGTGYVPPFMDDCIACGALTAAMFAPSSRMPVGTRRTMDDGKPYVWTGSAWVEIPTVEVRPGDPIIHRPPVEDWICDKGSLHPGTMTSCTCVDEVADEIADEILEELGVDAAAELLGMTVAVEDVIADTITAANTAVAEDDADAAAAYADEMTGLTHDEAMDATHGRPPMDEELADILDDLAPSFAPSGAKVSFDPKSLAGTGYGEPDYPDLSDDREPDYAAGYGEAGIYSDPSISYGSTPSTATRPMSEKQETLLRRLLAERNPVIPAVAAALARLDGTAKLSAKAASKLIDSIMAIPADPKLKPARPNSYDGTCHTCKGPVPAETGRIEKSAAGRWITYHLDGGCLTAEAVAEADANRVTDPGLYKLTTDSGTSIYRVRKSRMSDRLYAEKVIPNGDGTANFAYHPKAMSLLQASDKLTWAEARAFGAAYGSCVACGRTLSDARSLVQGYGNTCARHYRWPTVTKSQAEAIIAGTVTWEEVIAL